jgi:polar amino acid transport system substrate-binding protein
MSCARLKQSVNLAQWAMVFLLSSWVVLPAASAETILEKVARTGKLTAGTRTDAVPFAYLNPEGEWSGYSVDLLERIRGQLAQQLRQSVELELVAVDSNNQLAEVAEGDLDIVCGTVSVTRSRELNLGFSIGYFVTGTQLLINPAKPLGREFIIGAVASTTNEQLVRQRFPIARVVVFDNRAAGLTALERGRIDALASDGILLEAMRQTVPEAQPYEIVPDRPYGIEEYACVVPQDDPEFQEAVNQSLLAFMQGVLNGDPDNLEVLNTWFGPSGLVPIDTQPLFNYFQRQVDVYPIPAAATN